MDSTSGAVAKKSVSPKVSASLLSSVSIMVLVFAFESMIHFELSLPCDGIYGFKFFQF